MGSNESNCSIKVKQSESICLLANACHLRWTGSVPVWFCIQRHFSSLFFTSFVIGTFFSFCLSEAHCFSAQVSAITETNWQTSWKKTCTFRVNVYFFDVYSFPLNNARWNEVGWNAMVLFFLEVVFYAFHIRFVKSNQIWFFSS